MTKKYTKVGKIVTQDQFWQLIATVDSLALDNGDEVRVVLPLQTKLASLPKEALEEFHELLSQALYSLDGETFAIHAGESGKSADGFLYARCYVVAKGKEYYDSVVTSPMRMPKSIKQWCEPLLYCHRRAWADSTGSSESAWDFKSSVSYETGSNSALWNKQKRT